MPHKPQARTATDPPYPTTRVYTPFTFRGFVGFCFARGDGVGVLSPPATPAASVYSIFIISVFL